ncbi:MAG: stage V sporulation protein AD, partial [Defluviitaleaceae bacterium]|nr:stage V sporulation protein AD [Defluviitaleaceae bacterium]
GSKEGEGPLSGYFDRIIGDAMHGCTSWEQAESKFMQDGIILAVEKSGFKKDEIDAVLAGDLLNQIIGTSFALREINRPFIGLFGACSTFGLALGLSAMLVDGGFYTNTVASASSHFCSAEKQFRFPLEFGSQRTPTASWTVTGNGAAVVSRSKTSNIRITSYTVGKIVDLGISDVNNMGAAMAPAAVDTLITHFRDTGRNADYYDSIMTGDLGYIGRELTVKMAAEHGVHLDKRYSDCGIEIFDRDEQDTHNGGSGCGCAAVTYAGYLHKKLEKGDIKRLLLMPTGALLSPTSSQQGESIPGICHAVSIERFG